MALPGRALAVLTHLARHRGRVVPRDELISAVWHDAPVGDASLDQAVRRARVALGDRSARQEVIRTHRGRGYAFEAQGEVREIGRPIAGERFVGRATLLAGLERDVGLVFGGRGRIALLSGEPGIGKSRTAAELARRAGERGAIAWTGRGVELGEAPAFWIWSQILRRAFSDHRASPPRGDTALLRDAMPELGGGAGRGGRPLAARDGSQALFRLAGALVPTLRAWSDAAPLVLLLDDLHRADLASLRLLEIVAAELAGARIAWVGTYRDGELRGRAAAARTVASIARYANARSYAIGALTVAEVAELAADATSREVAREVAADLHARSGGNPFFVLQLLALGGPGRSLEWLARAPASVLPGAVREAIQVHVASLAPETRALLALAAAIGREFEAGVLAAAADEPVDTVVARLAEAAAIGVLHRPPEAGGDRYRFAHALVCETLLADRDPPSRRAGHRRIADALAARDDAGTRLAEIAEHRVLAARVGAPGDAVEACRAAAADARRRAAVEESVRWTRRALDLLGSGPPRDALRLALLLELGEACTASAEVEEGRRALREAFDLARRCVRPEEAARAALLYAGFEEAPPLDESRVRLLERALEGLPPGDHPLRARVLARLSMALLHADDPARRVRLAREARAMARRVGDDETMGHVALCVRSSAWAPDNLEERLVLDREQRLAAERLADPLLLHDALANLVGDLLESGDLAGVDATLAAHRAFAREARQPFIDWYVEHFRVMRGLLGGDLAEAEAALPRAFALGRRSDPAMALQWYGVQLYGLRRAQGRLAELRPVLRELVRDATTPVWHVALASADLAAGGARAARAALQTLVTPHGPALPRDYAWLAAVSALAELCAGLGAREEASIVHEALLAFRARHVVAGVGMLHLGPVERFLGQTATVLGRHDEAQALLDRALAEDLRLGARSSELRTRAARVALLRARGASRGEVSAERRRAREIARRAGLEGELRA